jgi:hypothetical protein
MILPGSKTPGANNSVRSKRALKESLSLGAACIVLWDQSQIWNISTLLGSDINWSCL